MRVSTSAATGESLISRDAPPIVMRSSNFPEVLASSQTSVPSAGCRRTMTELNLAVARRSVRLTLVRLRPPLPPEASQPPYINKTPQTRNAPTSEEGKRNSRPQLAARSTSGSAFEEL